VDALMLVSGESLRPYFEQRAGAVGPKAQFLGRWEGDRLLGVVAVWHYGSGNAEVGWAGDRGWLSRGFLRLVFAYLWGQLECRRITGRINASNDTAIAMSERLGFVREGTMRQAAPDGGDVHIYGLLRQECRYGR
jgi:RimJ/RimL family protein N-acetyltransferase